MDPRTKLTDLIKRAHIEISEDIDEHVLSDARQALDAKKPTEQHPARKERWIMLQRLTKISIAAVFVILCGIVILGQLDRSNVALAQVLEYIQQRSYSFDMTVTQGERKCSTRRAAILQPGRLRCDLVMWTGGEVTTIADVTSGKSLVLFHAYQTAKTIDTKWDWQDLEANDTPLFMALRPVERLWNMRDGLEEDLGTRKVEGVRLQGFRMQAESDEASSQITIWAERDTSLPYEVNMVTTYSDNPKETMTWHLSGFDFDCGLDEDDFDLTIPTGYTLTQEKPLAEVTPTIERTPAGLEAEQALALWKQGQQDQAIETLLSVDWSAHMEFSKKSYVFYMTVEDSLKLTEEAREELVEKVMAEIPHLRRMAMELRRLGQEAQDADKINEAEQYFKTCLALGETIDHNPDALLVVRMAGTACKNMALSSLEKLYQQTHQKQKRDEVQGQLETLHRDFKELTEKANAAH